MSGVERQITLEQRAKSALKRLLVKIRESLPQKDPAPVTMSTEAVQAENEKGQRLWEDVYGARTYFFEALLRSW